MFPEWVNAQAMQFSEGDKFGLGAMHDSFYEYLAKEYILLGGRGPEYRSMYETAMDTATRNIFFRPLNEGNLDILVSGEMNVYAGVHNLNPLGYLSPSAPSL
jgi:mannosyl-oligosaccharide alpha-1,2-mannosidase